jgi:hypothetical protein|nr:MAG TPA: hypothetical protein [Caudoviricetes sp.]
MVDMDFTETDEMIEYRQLTAEDLIEEYNGDDEYPTN